jgi:hypothetical protein
VISRLTVRYRGRIASMAMRTIIEPFRIENELVLNPWIQDDETFVIVHVQNAE